MNETPQGLEYRNILPKEASARVDRVIDKIRQMGKNNQWFTLRTPDELQVIVPQIQLAKDTLKESLNPFGEIRMFLSSPNDPVDYALIAVAKAAGRSEGADLAGETASSEVEKVAWPAAELAATGEIRTVGFWVDGDTQVMQQYGWDAPFGALTPLRGSLPMRREIKLLPIK